jgi:hypothetical protein
LVCNPWGHSTLKLRVLFVEVVIGTGTRYQKSKCELREGEPRNSLMRRGKACSLSFYSKKLSKN